MRELPVSSLHLADKHGTSSQVLAALLFFKDPEQTQKNQLTLHFEVSNYVPKKTARGPTYPKSQTFETSLHHNHATLTSLTCAQRQPGTVTGSGSHTLLALSVAQGPTLYWVPLTHHLVVTAGKANNG